MRIGEKEWSHNAAPNTGRRILVPGQEAVSIALRAIRADIRQQSLTQATAGKAKKHDLSDQAFWDKLAQHEIRLRRMLTVLLGRLASIEHRRPLLWRIPREQRYSARQSLDSDAANTLELAELTLRELLDLFGDAARMRPGDWENLGEKVTELAAKVDQAVLHHTVQQLQKGPAFTAAQPHAGLGIESLAPLIGLLIALIASKRRRT